MKIMKMRVVTAVRVSRRIRKEKRRDVHLASAPLKLRLVADDSHRLH